MASRSLLHATGDTPKLRANEDGSKGCAARSVILVTLRPPIPHLRTKERQRHRPEDHSPPKTASSSVTRPVPAPSPLIDGPRAVAGHYEIAPTDYAHFLFGASLREARRLSDSAAPDAQRRRQTRVGLCVPTTTSVTFLPI